MFGDGSQTAPKGVQLTDEEYNAFMAAAAAGADDEPGSNPDDLQDPIENDLKQSDQLTR